MARGGHRIARLNDKRAASGYNTRFLSDDSYGSEWWWISGVGRILSQTSADASDYHKRETKNRNRHDIVFALSSAISRPALDASITMISKPSSDGISTASHLIATALSVASRGLLPNMVFHVFS